MLRNLPSLSSHVLVNVNVPETKTEIVGYEHVHEHVHVEETGMLSFFSQGKAKPIGRLVFPTTTCS
jgi:hypothetical protein